MAVRDGLYRRGVQNISVRLPPRVDQFFDLFDPTHRDFDDLQSTKLLYGEDFASAYVTIASTFQGRANNALALALDGHFCGLPRHRLFYWPAAFPREDSHGNTLGYNRQVWPQDLQNGPRTA